MNDQPLWRPTPDQISRAAITAFTSAVQQRWGRTFVDYVALHHWSISKPEEFWVSIWEYCGVRAATPPGPAV
ncbi:MAG: hypothetical protein V1245_03180, partial [Arenicellales bacterium]|nr:hypothetical protein [Arenicellales bacterium]